MPTLNCQDRTARTELPGQNCRDRTAGTELLGQNCQDRTARTRAALTKLLGQDSQAGPKGKNRQNKTGEAELDRWNRMGRKERQKRVARTRLADRTASTTLPAHDC